MSKLLEQFGGCIAQEHTGNSETNCMQSIINIEAKFTGNRECFLNVLLLYSDLVVFLNQLFA